MLRDKEQSIRDLQTSHRQREITWEAERERLLNRMMTKEWQSYVQMNGAMQTASDSQSEPEKGLSDEEELRRIGVDPEGLGETYVEMSGFPELGFGN